MRIIEHTSTKSRQQINCLPREDATCTDISPYITMKYSWSCRSCFDITVNYTFQDAGIGDFTADNTVVIGFSRKIISAQYSNPINNIESIGLDSKGHQLIKLYFNHTKFADQSVVFKAGSYFIFRPF